LHDMTLPPQTQLTEDPPPLRFWFVLVWGFRSGLMSVRRLHMFQGKGVEGKSNYLNC